LGKKMLGSAARRENRHPESERLQGGGKGEYRLLRRRFKRGRGKARRRKGHER